MDLASILHLNATQVFFLYLVFWVISTALNALPQPTEKSSAGYRWFYGFSHGLMASWANVADAIKPKEATNAGGTNVSLPSGTTTKP